MKRILFIMCILVGINTYGQKKKSTQKYTKSYTTVEALAYVDDYFRFYEADLFYEDPEVRKISNNVFHVRVDICAGSCYETNAFGYRQKKDFLWRPTVYTLTIGTGGKYSMRAGY